MNPDQERKAKEKQLLELEEELGLIPRRKLQTKIDVMKSDLKHAVQLAQSHAYDPANVHRVAHLFWKDQILGMKNRSEVEW